MASDEDASHNNNELVAVNEREAVGSNVTAICHSHPHLQDMNVTRIIDPESGS
jgi:hypothetical protein